MNETYIPFWETENVDQIIEYNDFVTFSALALDYGYFLQPDLSSIKRCVNKISQIIDNLFSIVSYKWDSVPSCKWDRTIQLTTINNLRSMAKEQIDFLEQYVKKNLGVVNDIILEYFLVLHEYGHLEHTFSDKYKKEYERINKMKYGPEQWEAYRQISYEKEADEFAFNFIKKHWDFLMS